MIIAVDFDGTIVEDAYPKIGEPVLFAVDTLLEMQRARHQLILWTTRTGKPLEEAVNWCKDQGIEFYAVNKSYPEEKMDATVSRKINCDIFISSKNVGEFMGWGEMWQEIQRLEGRGLHEVEKPKSLIQRLFNLFQS